MEISSRTQRSNWRSTSLFEITKRLSEIIERVFYWIGYNVAKQPYKWLFLTTLSVLTCISGLYFFRYEKNALKLWVPPDSDFVHDTTYLFAHVESGLQVDTLILTADNVLEPHILILLNNITSRIMNAQSRAIKWEDVCFKVPSITNILTRHKRNVDPTGGDFFDLEPEAEITRTDFEPAVEADPKLYCQILNSIPKVCLMHNILDIWNYDNNEIEKETNESIIERLNSADISPTLGLPMNFTELLGGTIKDKNGRIISAKAIKIRWAIHINFTEINTKEFGNKMGTAEWVR